MANFLNEPTNQVTEGGVFIPPKSPAGVAQIESVGRIWELVHGKQRSAPFVQNFCIEGDLDWASQPATGDLDQGTRTVASGTELRMRTRQHSATVAFRSVVEDLSMAVEVLM